MTQAAEKPIILVSNDDGVGAEGIKALASALAPLGRVVVCAPHADQSAVSHSMSLRRPLRLNKHENWPTAHGDVEVYSVDGTPTDAVYMAAHHVLRGQQIALVAAGINHGANLGYDVLYSGTVSAAMEGTTLGLPAVAFSLVANHNFDFTHAAHFAYGMCKSLLENPMPRGSLLNVNVPKRPTQEGYCVTELGRHAYSNDVEERCDPRGKSYYWIGGKWAGFEDLPGTDCNAVAEGAISVTPLEIKLTNKDMLPWVHTLNVDGFTSKAYYENFRDER